MLRTRILNLVDIFQLKKDLLWGKYYYGLFDNGKLVDSILYSSLYGNRKLCQIHNTGNRTRDLLNQLTNFFAQRKKVRYFLAEFDELEQVQDIEFMHSCGFRRYSRNHCFEFDSKQHSLKNSKPAIFCRSLDRQDIIHLIDIDASAQVMDYRDEFFRTSKFFKAETENIIVFCNPANLNQIYGFASKRDLVHDSSFDFILHSRDINLQDCIQAFAEYYIHFEKTAESFRFILSDNYKGQFEEIAKSHKQIWTSQCLLLEGAPREKDKQTSSTVAFRRATAN